MDKLENWELRSNLEANEQELRNQLNMGNYDNVIRMLSSSNKTLDKSRFFKTIESELMHANNFIIKNIEYAIIFIETYERMLTSRMILTENSLMQIQSRNRLHELMFLICNTISWFKLSSFGLPKVIQEHPIIILAKRTMDERITQTTRLRNNQSIMKQMITYSVNTLKIQFVQLNYELNFIDWLRKSS